MSSTIPDQRISQQGSAVQLEGIDHVELYVGNALQAAHFYRTVFGFTPVAYAGLETNTRDRVSRVMQRDQAIFVLTAPLDAESSIAEHIRLHGEGVKDIAFRVKNTSSAFEQAVRLGARPVIEPTVYQDAGGEVTKATIATYGDITHSFIQRDNFHGVFFPTYQTIAPVAAPDTGLSIIDHVAVSLNPGDLHRWVDFYTHVFGLQLMHEENIQTEYSAMNSIAVQDSTGLIKLVLIEPKEGKRQSQIAEFLNYHSGPGIQHIALHTDNIIQTIDTLKDRGLGLVAAPTSYYDLLSDRVGAISEDRAALRALNILVDRDEWGYLLQIFSKPLQDRPTLFIEIIQRKNARGFGSGNIQALFKALEVEQAQRGNL